MSDHDAPDAPLHELRRRLRPRTRARQAARAAISRWLRSGASPDDVFGVLGELTPYATSRGRPRFLFNTADVAISPHLYAASGYDEPELEWALEHLGQPQRGGTVVEVGGNVGSTTVSLLAQHGAAHVATFEPEPENLALLRCNLILNGVDGQATVRQAAITDREGEVELELAGENVGDHRVRVGGPSAGALAEGDRATISVPALPLDSALREAGIAPGDVSLVWVDTQGHEAQVLAGALGLLAGAAPWVVEYWPYGLERASGLARFHELVAAHFTEVVDVRASIDTGRVVALPAADVSSLAPPAADHRHFTDLILRP